jgi:hypothetical protein
VSSIFFLTEADLSWVAQLEVARVVWIE